MLNVKADMTGLGGHAQPMRKVLITGNISKIIESGLLQSIANKLGEKTDRNIRYRKLAPTRTLPLPYNGSCLPLCICLICEQAEDLSDS